MIWKSAQPASSVMHKETDSEHGLKDRSLAVAFFAVAAVLYGGLLALYMESLQAAAGVAAYACIAATLTAGALGTRLRQRAISSTDPAGGLFDGARVTVLAYVLGVVLAAVFSAVATPHNGFWGVAAVGLTMSAFLLPPALILGALAGLAFRLAVIRGAV